MHPESDSCLNCGYPLKENHAYCPECGQKKTAQFLSLKILIGDFLSNYFAFDSKLGRSMHHFFLRPGYLTRRYNEGKRVRYVHPLRLYLVISVFFFFLLSFLLSLQLEEASIQRMADTEATAAAAATKLQPGEEISAEDSLALAELNKLQERNPDLFSPTDSATVSIRENEFSQEENFRDVLGWLRNEELSNEMVMDSLSFDAEEKADPTYRLLVHQSRRVAQKDLDVFLPYLLKNLPLMMFLLLPIFALYLKFLFRNKPNLYIRHMIHALHLHSMAFLLLTLFLIIGWISGAYFFWTTFLLVTVYAFLSIKNVYQQRWLRSLFKFSLLGLFYFGTLFLFVLAEAAISFFTF